jgi:hypothetical protein
MKHCWKIFAVILLAGGFVAGFSIPVAAQSFDHRLFDELLAKYIKDGRVDYQGLKSEEQKLDKYLALLDAADPETLSTEEQFALYANAYNAYTIKLIVENYPVKSIKDLGSLLKTPWKKEIVKLGGQVYTLDNIEHDILRPQFQDPRIHFAINCAAKDCPPLYPEAFWADRLDDQLERNTRAFLNNPEKTYLKGNTLYVTSIFKWFKEDFENDPLSFVLKYVEGDFKKELEAKKDDIKVKYLSYDWSLNEA